MMLEEAAYFQFSVNIALLSLFFPYQIVYFLPKNVFAVMYWLEICLAYHSVEHILMLLLAPIWSVKISFLL
jgi:hypothetical protein